MKPKNTQKERSLALSCGKLIGNQITSSEVERLTTGSASSHHVVNAWAVVKNDTGRLVLIDVGDRVIQGKPCWMESPAIYMTKVAAKYHCCNDERVVRVELSET